MEFIQISDLLPFTTPQVKLKQSFKDGVVEHADLGDVKVYLSQVKPANVAQPDV